MTNDLLFNWWSYSVMYGGCFFWSMPKFEKPRKESNSFVEVYPPHPNYSCRLNKMENTVIEGYEDLSNSESDLLWDLKWQKNKQKK